MLEDGERRVIVRAVGGDVRQEIMRDKKTMAVLASGHFCDFIQLLFM